MSKKYYAVIDGGGCGTYHYGSDLNQTVKDCCKLFLSDWGKSHKDKLKNFDVPVFTLPSDVIHVVTKSNGSHWGKKNDGSLVELNDCQYIKPKNIL